MMKPFFAIVALALLPLGALGQANPAGREIRVEPEVQSVAVEENRAQAKRASRSTRIALEQPTQDELAQIGAPRKGVPHKIGFPRPIAPLVGGLPAALDWEMVDGLRVASLSITSPGAAALRLQLRPIAIPAAARLRFHAPESTEIHEFTGEEILETVASNVIAGDRGEEANAFWSPVIEGDTIVLEIELPADARESDLRLAVPKLSHLVTSARSDFTTKASASCHNDATCSLGTWPEINAVARMVFSSGGSTYVCTGTLLADTDASTTIPYFLTANHCIGTQSEASSVQTYWFYRSSACNGSGTASYQTRTGGGQLRYGSTNTDSTLLQLNSTPPAGTIYAGWLIGSVLPLGENVTGIHHPTGDLLKISFGDIDGYLTCSTPNSEGQFSCSSSSAGSSRYYAVDWTSGITEGGSSGSGLFRDNGRYLVGQLYGGGSSCSLGGGGDIYGRFDVAFSAGMSQWLDVPPRALTVSLAGNGVGSVTSAPAGINCGTTCSAEYASGTTVTLTATPQAASRFAGWSGPCSGTGTCTVTLNAAASVTATFAYNGASFPGTSLPPNWVSYDGGWSVVTGSAGGETFEGSQALRSDPIGNSAAARLSYTATFNSGTVTFARRVSSGAGDALRFYIDGVLQAEWSGTVPWALVSFPLSAGTHTLLWAYEKNASGAAGSDAAWIDAVNLPLNTAVMRNLAVTRSGAGSGTVTSVPAGINCGGACSFNFAHGTPVVLTAVPAAGSQFAGWSGGGCSGTSTCTVMLSSSLGVSATFTVAPAGSSGPSRLANISTRGQVLAGNDVMIGGFVIGGSANKTVLVRARGPSLASFGIANALSNPSLQLIRSADQATLAVNDNWGSASNAAQISASGLAPSNALEAAILATLGPGSYSVILSGSGGTTGVGIVEVFEVDAPSAPLVNISTRGRVMTGNDVMIGGFVIQGDGPQTVVIRARGPSLVPFGISNALANPALQLVRSSDQVTLATNDNWGSAANAAQISASGFAPSNSLESAILITLNPGAYTAIVTGSGGVTGVGIVEVFAQ